MAKQPILVVFGVGSLAQYADPPNDRYADDHLLGLKPHRNMMEIVRHYLGMPHAEVVFCSGRPKRAFRPTWSWLNSHLRLTSSGRRVSLVCRSDAEPVDRTPACKVHEIVQAIRRVGSRPAEAIVFDDDLRNLRLFETLRPMVRHLRLFKVEDDGIAASWRL